MFLNVKREKRLSKKQQGKRNYVVDHIQIIKNQTWY